MILAHPEYQNCPNCGHDFKTVENECPKCRQSAIVRQVRTGGIVLIVLGAVLVAVMAFVVRGFGMMIVECDKLGGTDRGWIEAG